MQEMTWEHNIPSYDNVEYRLRKKRAQLAFKRGCDIVTSLVLILLFAPILLLVAILIKCSSRGDVLYSNVRVGYNGKHFRCYKFRSMVSNQSLKRDVHSQAIEQSRNGVLLKMADDPRVTWIGRIIRKTSIDELPQLFNVLRGDMSIIGPRPLVPFMLEQLPEFTKIRCLMRPGITGLWQIRDRENNTSARFMIKHDLEYIINYSLLMDIKILSATPKAVASGEGAY